MHEFLIEDKLKRKLKKLFKKDNQLYNSVMNKIDEILNCTDLSHYKNLKKPMQRFKRVHIGSFVLIFKVQRKIIFYELEHHDKIY
ncbi:MAG: addiction module toxin RelE [Nanoarchaeota archaeon]|nr:addiction module toxin RelE [Nanoarchaeota archaeon]